MWLARRGSPARVGRTGPPRRGNRIAW